ncbi:acyl-CoA dehydrogenase family protein [Amycolatopsis jejuensis]|uniref:acyl-CoA dehydrogenase family protein n=1 Tax=Amycolatopsis jejuensis TaxID=330084 RepID=UPI000525A695|nr:acyl-CoA dehydrogenase family protein [Amycolatopsis jejuensis]
MTDVRPLPPPVLASPWATPSRLELQAEARRFARDEVLPVADELDPRRADFPDGFLDRIAQQGYFGIMVPTAGGGLGLGVFEYCLVAEELARAWMSVASIIARGQGMGTAVPDPDRRAELLKRSAAGRWIGAAGFSEPGAGSDLAGVATRATRTGDSWVIDGRKRWTGFALKADFIQVLARTRDPGPGEPRAAGLVNLLVPKERGSFPPGITGRPIDKIGYHGFTTWELDLDDVRVPAGNVLGEDGNGTESFRAVQHQLNVARVHTAARAVGLARAAVEDCVAYLQQREQFGHPLADFQALRFDLAEMAAAVEQARSFYQAVAHRIDLGERCEREAAMCKLTATEMAVRVTNQAMQLFGGNGYTTEHQVERHWRDARLTTIFEGTSQIQKRIIADRMLPRSPLS